MTKCCIFFSVFAFLNMLVFQSYGLNSTGNNVNKPAVIQTQKDTPHMPPGVIPAEERQEEEDGSDDDQTGENDLINHFHELKFNPDQVIKSNRHAVTHGCLSGIKCIVFAPPDSLV